MAKKYRISGVELPPEACAGEEYYLAGDCEKLLLALQNIQKLYDREDMEILDPLAIADQALLEWAT